MSDRREPTETQYIPWWKIIVWTLLFQIAWSWRVFEPVLLNGELVGPDDFLRFHQIENWMNGQAWYDQTVYRMFPPDGADIHWSRLVDVPVASITWFFNLFAPYELAMRIATIVWPTALMVATVLVLVAICDRLIRDSNRLLVMLFAVLCASSVVEFAPGRIDHHNVQILLFTLVMLGMVMRPEAKGDILIGASIPVSISVGLDSAPLFVPILAYLGYEWANGKDEGGTGLRRVATTMVVASLIMYGFNLPPDRWSEAHCDAYSLFYLTALVLVALDFLVLSSIAGILSRFPGNPMLVRLFVGGVLALISVGILLWFFPHCANGPLSGVSDELNQRWLVNVHEAKSLANSLRATPAGWLDIVGYMIVMLAVATFVVAKRAKGSPQLVVAYFILLICTVGIFYQVRVMRTGIYSVVPFCVIFAMMSWSWLRQRFADKQIVAMAIQVIVCVVLISATWTTASTKLFASRLENALTLAQRDDDSVEAVIDNEPVAKIKRRNKTQCQSAADYDLLKAQERGLVLSDLNHGTPILVHTDHSVVAGPYHRNGKAILDVVGFLASDEVRAKEIIDRNNVNYIAFCKGNVLAPENEDDVRVSIGWRILNDDLPDWLEKLSTGEDDRVALVRVLRTGD